MSHDDSSAACFASPAHGAETLGRVCGFGTPSIISLCNNKDHLWRKWAFSVRRWRRAEMVIGILRLYWDTVFLLREIRELLLSFYDSWTGLSRFGSSHFYSAAICAVELPRVMFQDFNKVRSHTPQNSNHVTWAPPTHTLIGAWAGKDGRDEGQPRSMQVRSPFAIVGSRPAAFSEVKLPRRMKEVQKGDWWRRVMPEFNNQHLSGLFISVLNYAFSCFPVWF